MDPTDHFDSDPSEAIGTDAFLEHWHHLRLNRGLYGVSQPVVRVLGFVTALLLLEGDVEYELRSNEKVIVQKTGRKHIQMKVKERMNNMVLDSFMD